MIDIVRTSSFWRDLKDILDFFADVFADDVAGRFLDAIDESINFIGEFPALGNPWESTNPRHAGLRFRLVKGFEKYLLLYRQGHQHVHILRLVHGSQNIMESLD